MRTTPRSARHLPLALITTISAVLALDVAPRTQTQAANELDWRGRGVWLTADLHTHTRFSDGPHQIDEVVAAAVKNGCDVVGITDHADRNLNAATPEYVSAIQAARVKYPAVTILTGLEWNIPPGGGEEHATVLFPAAMEDVNTLSSFQNRFDDYHRNGDRAGLADEALTALSISSGSGASPVVIVNHPSRTPQSASAPALTFERLKGSAPSLVIGFEGAPGHQRGRPIGAYPPDVVLPDRWDPLAATVDGAWDQWLRKGLDVWAAIANSDFHSERDDFWPCEFASTRVYAPDRTVDGVLRALRAGRFFAEHGHIVSDVELLAHVEGDRRTIGVGDSIATNAGVKVIVSLTMKAPATDYLGRNNQIDQVELIGISSTGTNVLFSGSPGDPDAFKTTVLVPEGGIVLRARGRRGIDREQGLAFYTNPIRISTTRR